ncbi:MAG: hypothetical protein JW820_08540 [Spirochaetales bacterium]|nr:hypothetical protein [Spirochaetales bacterium]
MNRSRVLKGVGVCLIFLAAAQAGLAFDLFDQVLAADGYNEIRPANGMVVRWRVEGPRLRLVLEAPTRGWVGIGFKPEFKMQGANFLIGYVRRGEAFIEDHAGTHKDKHGADTRLEGTRDVELVAGSEADGRTRLEFTIPLDSGDPRDKPLVPGERVPLLLCYGPDDSVTRVHTIEAEAKGDIRL